MKRSKLGREVRKVEKGKRLELEDIGERDGSVNVKGTGKTHETRMGRAARKNNRREDDN